MTKYLDRKGVIHDSLKNTLDVPAGLVVDDMPPDTEIPIEVQTQIDELQEWLNEQNFKKVPEEVQAQVERLLEKHQQL